MELWFNRVFAQAFSTLFLIWLASFCWLDGHSGWCYSSWDGKRPPKISLNKWHGVALHAENWQIWNGFNNSLSWIRVRLWSRKLDCFQFMCAFMFSSTKSHKFCQKWPSTSTMLKPPLASDSTYCLRCHLTNASLLARCAAGVGLLGREKVMGR